MGYKIRKIMSRSDGIHINVLFDNGDVHSHIFSLDVKREIVEQFFDNLDDSKMTKISPELQALVGLEKNFDNALGLLDPLPDPAPPTDPVGP